MPRVALLNGGEMEVVVILVILAIFTLLMVYAVRNPANHSLHSNELLLREYRLHLRFVRDSNRLGGKFFYSAMHKSCPAEKELIRRGFDLEKLLAEEADAHFGKRPIDWEKCRVVADEGATSSG